MRNLCFTDRSLQFSEIAHKSLGSSISLLPLFFLSLPVILSRAISFPRAAPLPRRFSFASLPLLLWAGMGASGSGGERAWRRRADAERTDTGHAGGRPAAGLRLQAGGAEAECALAQALGERELERGHRRGAELGERWRAAPGELAQASGGGRLAQAARASRHAREHVRHGWAQGRSAGGGLCRCWLRPEQAQRRNRCWSKRGARAGTGAARGRCRSGARARR
jgi:hypothetical protein